MTNGEGPVKSHYQLVSLFALMLLLALPVFAEKKIHNPLFCPIHQDIKQTSISPKEPAKKIQDILCGQNKKAPIIITKNILLSLDEALGIITLPEFPINTVISTNNGIGIGVNGENAGATVSGNIIIVAENNDNSSTTTLDTQINNDTSADTNSTSTSTDTNTDVSTNTDTSDTSISTDTQVDNTPTDTNTDTSTAVNNDNQTGDTGADNNTSINSGPLSSDTNTNADTNTNTDNTTSDNSTSANTSDDTSANTGPLNSDTNTDVNADTSGTTENTTGNSDTSLNNASTGTVTDTHTQVSSNDQGQTQIDQDLNISNSTTGTDISSNIEKDKDHKGKKHWMVKLKVKQNPIFGTTLFEMIKTDIENQHFAFELGSFIFPGILTFATNVDINLPKNEETITQSMHTDVLSTNLDIKNEVPGIKENDKSEKTLHDEVVITETQASHLNVSNNQTIVIPPNGDGSIQEPIVSNNTKAKQNNNDVANVNTVVAPGNSGNTPAAVNANVNSAVLGGQGVNANANLGGIKVNISAH